MDLARDKDVLAVAQLDGVEDHIELEKFIPRGVSLLLPTCM
jgi:hypothetical protein